jgi:transcriptional regulator with XRE-family HTH domain
MNPITEMRAHNRTQKKLTRGDLSKRTNVSYAGLCNLENGLPLSMSDKTAEKLSAFCGLSPERIQSMYADWRNSLTFSE